MKEGIDMKILVLFYSTYGHIYKMAEAIAEGAAQVDGASVSLRRVPETLPDSLLESIGALEAQKAFSHIPVCTVEELTEYDSIIFGTPTRYGSMAAQMKAFLDGTGAIWAKGGLIGKVGSVFTSSSTQHGGQESTILGFHTVLLHHGMVLVGLPYSFAGQMGVEEVKGGSPYGASTIAGAGDRLPSAIELEAARFQGKRVAEIAGKLSK